MTELWRSPESALARLRGHLELNNHTLYYYTEPRNGRKHIRLHIITLTQRDNQVRPIDITGTVYMALGVPKDRVYVTLLWEHSIYELEQLMEQYVGYPMELSSL